MNPVRINGEARRSKSKGNGHIDWTKYKLDIGMSISARQAEALHWAAEHHPGVFIDARTLTKVVYGLPKPPAQGALEVKRVKQATGTANRYLNEKYGREIVVERGVGLRGSTGHYDKAANVLPRRTARLASASRAVERTVAGIDVREIPNTPECKPVRDFALRCTKGLLPMLQSDDWKNRLLPPADPDEEPR